MDMLPSFSGTPLLFRAFEDSTVIYFGISVNISTCIPTVIMDLIVDMMRRPIRSVVYLMPREKGIVFTVNNQFDERDRSCLRRAGGGRASRPSQRH